MTLTESDLAGKTTEGPVVTEQPPIQAPSTEQQSDRPETDNERASRIIHAIMGELEQSLPSTVAGGYETSLVCDEIEAAIARLKSQGLIPGSEETRYGIRELTSLPTGDKFTYSEGKYEYHLEVGPCAFVFVPENHDGKTDIHIGYYRIPLKPVPTT